MSKQVAGKNKMAFFRANKSLSSRAAPSRFFVRILSMLCAAGLAGCLVGPDFSPPQTEFPAGWQGTTAGETAAPAMSAATAKPLGAVDWWQVFEDPLLNSLVQQAVESNLDLKQAETRVREARANLSLALAGLFPTVDATGQYRRGNSVGQSTNVAVSKGPHDFFQAGFDSTWELDFFGGTRRSVEAADAGLESAIESRRDTLVTLLSEVARNYVELRGAQRELAVARENVQIQQESVRLSRERYGAGFVSYLDVANADAQVATTQSQIPPLESSVKQSIYNISILLGKPPAAFVEQLSSVQPISGCAAGSAGWAAVGAAQTPAGYPPSRNRSARCRGSSRRGDSRFVPQIFTDQLRRREQHDSKNNCR